MRPRRSTSSRASCDRSAVPEPPPRYRAPSAPSPAPGSVDFTRETSLRSMRNIPWPGFRMRGQLFGVAEPLFLHARPLDRVAPARERRTSHGDLPRPRAGGPEHRMPALRIRPRRPGDARRSIGERAPAPSGSPPDGVGPFDEWLCRSCGLRWPHERPPAEVALGANNPGSATSAIPGERIDTVDLPEVEGASAVTSGRVATILREAREARGLTVSDASKATRIWERYLHALEANAPLQEFPAPVYARSFLRARSSWSSTPTASSVGSTRTIPSQRIRSSSRSPFCVRGDGRSPARSWSSRSWPCWRWRPRGSKATARTDRRCRPRQRVDEWRARRRPGDTSSAPAPDRRHPSGPAAGRPVLGGRGRRRGHARTGNDAGSG